MAAMPFEPGKSGNPAGRPAGSRNAATLAMDALIDGETDAITRKCIELAKAGDGPALRLCMERLGPPRKERSVSFAMPAIDKPADCITAMAAIFKGVADGELTPGEAESLSKILDGYKRTVDLVDLAARIEALEQRTGERQ